MNKRSKITAVSLCAAQLMTMIPLTATASAASSDFSVNTIAVGENHSLVIKSDMSLWAAGDNSSGQLGAGQDTDSSNGVKIMDKAAYIAANDDVSFAIDQNGALYGWGDNSKGQVSPDSTSPVIYKPQKLMDNVAQVSVGDDHTVVLLQDGSVMGWGGNEYGELGFSSNARKNTSTKLMDNAVDIAAGNGFTLIVTKDGEVYASGNNENGQLGTGDFKDLSTFQKVVSGGAAEAEAGDDHTVLLMSDGTVKTTGSNDDGQLGYDGYASGNYFERVNISGARDIFAGGDSSGVVTNDGTMYTWGADDYGQLHDSDTDDEFYPVKVANGAVSVALGTHHSLLLKSNGTVSAAGYGSYGELFSTQNTIVTKPAYTAKDIAYYSAGQDHSAAIDNSGRLYTWGNNDKGQLGLGDYTARTTPTRVKLDDEAVGVWCGDKVTIVQTRDNTTYVFGDNSGSLLGMKSRSSMLNKPTENEYLSGTAIEKIVFGSGYALAIIGSDVYGWGTNTSSRLCALGKTVTYPDIVDSSLRGATDIAAGDSFAFALTGGVLRGWGSNSSKQLGMDTDTRIVDTPVQITITDKKDNELVISAVAASGDHVIAVTNDGDVYAWGGNTSGQLGTEDYRLRKPTKVSYAGSIVATSSDFSAIVDDITDGVSLAGNNSKGQLGDGTTKNSFSFSKAVVEDVTAVSLGNGFGGCVTDTGKLFCWGDNSYGQVGNGSGGSNTEPKTIFTDGLCRETTIKEQGISLDKTEVGLAPNKSVKLTATVTPSNATNRNVTWSSSDTSVATVSDAGLVKTLKNGSAVITAKTASGLTAQCSVSVSTPVTSFSVKPGKSKTLNIDGTFTFKAKIYPAAADDKTLLYSSSDEGVAVVDENGTVTAVAPGSAKITVTAKSNTAKTRTVTVNVRPAKVNITYRKATEDGIRLEWDQSDYAEGYVIYRRNSAKGSGKNIGEIVTDDPEEMSFIDSSAVKGKTYYYYIKSYITVGGKRLYSSASKIYKIKAK